MDQQADDRTAAASRTAHVGDEAREASVSDVLAAYEIEKVRWADLAERLK
ncbi:hypothetical protein [Rhodococcus qingshengii]